MPDQAQLIISIDIYPHQDQLLQLFPEILDFQEPCILIGQEDLDNKTKPKNFGMRSQIQQYRVFQIALTGWGEIPPVGEMGNFAGGDFFYMMAKT